MKSSLKNLGLAALAALSLTYSAHALAITPATVPQWTGNQTSQPQIDAAIAPIIGSSVELYKQNVGDASDTGTLAGSYTTTFSNTPLDPSDALIHYVGGTVVGPTAYLLVKDGNQTPAWYLFNLTANGWTGVEDLVLTGFWPQQGAISHVALYGTTSTRVPDSGTTLMLLGLALTSVALIRRKLAA